MERIAGILSSSCPFVFVVVAVVLIVLLAGNIEGERDDARGTQTSQP